MSNEIKTALLGINFSAASQRLRKLILFNLVQRFNQDSCFRCSEQIEDIDDLSIEHKESWQSASDPKAAFFDLENIAFSHLRCNVRTANGNKMHCPKGHGYTDDNTENGGRGYRRCKKCRRWKDKKRYSGEEYRRKRKEYPSRSTKPS